MLSGICSAAAFSRAIPPGTTFAAGSADSAGAIVLPRNAEFDVADDEGVSSATAVFGPLVELPTGGGLDLFPGIMVWTPDGADAASCGLMAVTFAASLEERPGIMVFTTCGSFVARAGETERSAVLLGMPDSVPPVDRFPRTAVVLPAGEPVELIRPASAFWLWLVEEVAPFSKTG